MVDAPCLLFISPWILRISLHIATGSIWHARILLCPTQPIWTQLVFDRRKFEVALRPSEIACLGCMIVTRLEFYRSIDLHCWQTLVTGPLLYLVVELTGHPAGLRLVVRAHAT